MFGGGGYSGSSGSYLIDKRREEEARRQVSESNVGYFNQAVNQAKFEKRTEVRMRSARVDRRVREAEEKEKEVLSIRKQKLRDLLSEETLDCQRIIEGNAETPESRRQALEERVREIKLQKAQQEDQFARDAEDRRWRRDCDALRGQESKALSRQVYSQREDQLEERERRAAQAKAEKESYDKAALEDMERKLERELKEKKRIQEVNDNTVKVLDSQMNELRIMREEERKAKEAELRDITARWDEMQTEEKMVEEYEKAGRLRAREEMEHYNKILVSQRRVEQQKETENDKKLLEMHLEKERIREGEEQIMKERKAQQSLRYREHLVHQMKIEAGSEAELDKLRAEEQERAWDRRQTVWDREEKQRKDLMNNVLETRRIQVNEKNSIRGRQQEDDRRERERGLREAEAGKQMIMDERRVAADKKAALRRELDIQTEMNRQVKEDEKRKAREEEERARHLLMEEDQRISHELTKEVKPGNYPLKHTVWN